MSLVSAVSYFFLNTIFKLLIYNCLEILAMHTTDEKLIKEAIALLKKSNSLEYAQKRATEIISRAWRDIGPILKESPAKAKLKAFADYLVEREF